MYGNKLGRAAKLSKLRRCSKWYKRNHTKQCKYLHCLMTVHELVRKEIKKKKQTFAWSITYLNEWKHFCREFLLSLQYLAFVFLFFLHFCLLSHFKIANYMHCEIIDGYFCWNTTEKRKLREFGCPNWGITVSQSTWICHCLDNISSDRFFYGAMA